jgi:ornithine carbamoyltransferase
MSIKMKPQLKGRSLITLMDFSENEIRLILDLSHKLKKERSSNRRTGLKKRMRFASKNLALIFEKRSTRTRCAVETAFGEEGGHPVFLTLHDLHLGAKESIKDTARVLGRMFDCIVFRGFKQQTIIDLAAYSGIPVHNALTDDFHPTQVLADLMTIEESFGTFKGIKCAYVGDGRNNMARSLLIGCSKMGVDVTIVAPDQLHPEHELISRCNNLAEKSGSVINVTDSIETGVTGAHIIYTDVWTSMGEEAKKDERFRLLSPYQVNKQLMEMTGNKKSIFLHCLPAEKGKEVTEEVFEGPWSRVWDQAENRKHTIKALLLLTIG